MAGRVSLLAVGQGPPFCTGEVASGSGSSVAQVNSRVAAEGRPWAEAFEKLAEAKGIAERLESKGGRPGKNADTVAALAKEVGVKPRTARRRLYTAKKLASHPDLKAKEKEMITKRVIVCSQSVQLVSLDGGKTWVWPFSLAVEIQRVHGERRLRFEASLRKAFSPSPEKGVIR